MKPNIIAEVVLAAMMQSTDDLMLDKPCRCGGVDHRPATDCYLPPGFLEALKPLTDDDEGEHLKA